VYHLAIFQAAKPGYYSTAIGAMGSGDGFGHRRGRNGEFCAAVGQDCWLKKLKVLAINTGRPFGRNWLICILNWAQKSQRG